MLFCHQIHSALCKPVGIYQKNKIKYTIQSETCKICIILPAEKVPVCWTELLALCQISHSAPPCSPPLPGSPTADASGTQSGKLLLRLAAHGNLQIPN